MNNNPAKEKAFIHQFSQDELLRKIEHEYTTSAAVPITTQLESDQCIEDTSFVPSSIMEKAIDAAPKGKEGEEKLHFRNQAQAEHTINAERSAIAYWAK